MRKQKETRKRSARLSVKITGILSAILFAVSCSVFSGSPDLSPFNELGEIDYFGQIVNGEITPDVLDKIKDKTVEVISQAALYDYALLKKYARDNGIVYR